MFCVWEAEGMNIRAFPDVLSAFAKQKTCSLSRNQKTEWEEEAKTRYGGLKEAEQKIQVLQIVVAIGST